MGQEVVLSRKLKDARGSGNIFLDVGFNKAEAENLKMRAALMMRIEDWVKEGGRTQAAAAKLLGLTQPRLDALLKGRIGVFSLDSLLTVASKAGLSVRLVVTEYDPETRFRLRAARGAGKAARGLQLLAKARGGSARALTAFRPPIRGC